MDLPKLTELNQELEPRQADSENMVKRREILGSTGAVLLTGIAGCSGQQASTSSENQQNKQTSSEGGLDLAIPFDGLGLYEEEVRSADSLEESTTNITAQQVNNILENSETVEEEADKLADIGDTGNLYSVLQEYHSQKEEGEDMVLANINWGFYQQSKPIIEYHTVQNGELQGQPIITDPFMEITKHKPGQNNPEYLKAIRTDDRWTKSVPQDMEAHHGYIEDQKEEDDLTKNKAREARETYQEKWGYGLFGVEDESNLIPYDEQSSNVVFDGLYHGENTEAVVQLNQEYAESGLTDTDEVVSAQYTGEGWEFEV